MKKMTMTMNYIDDAAIDRIPSIRSKLAFYLLKFSIAVASVSLAVMVFAVGVIAAIIGLLLFLSPVWVPIWMLVRD